MPGVEIEENESRPQCPNQHGHDKRDHATRSAYFGDSNSGKPSVGINSRTVGPIWFLGIVFPALQAGLGKLPGLCPCIGAGCGD